MGGGKVNWTSENDAKLLVAILSTANVKPDNALLAQKMTEMTGCDVTASSIQNRLVRIKRQAQETTSTEKNASGSEPSTPKKDKGEKRKKAAAKSYDEETVQSAEGKENLIKRLKKEALDDSDTQ